VYRKNYETVNFKYYLFYPTFFKSKTKVKDLKVNDAICSWEIGAKVDFPESEFLDALVSSFGESMKGLFINEQARDLFLEILPFFERQKEWTPWKLFRALKDANRAETIKSHSTLIRYLDGFVTAGLLQRVISKSVTYGLNEAGSLEIQFLTQVVPSREFRNYLEEEFKYLHSTTCYIARLLRKFFPTGTERQIFGLGAVLLGAIVKLATRDLEPLGVLVRQCAACYYAPDPLGLTPIEKKSVEDGAQNG